MDNEPKITQVDIELAKDVGELVYKGNRFEVKRVGEESWQYGVYLDGVLLEKVTGLDICIRAGELPMISLEMID